VLLREEASQIELRALPSNRSKEQVGIVTSVIYIKSRHRFLTSSRR
jgi:hypothetical protein